MKKHTQDFKDNISRLGRESDTILLRGDTRIESENINSINYNIQTTMLKSVMKELKVETKELIPKGEILNLKFGILTDNDYEYLNFGNFEVYEEPKKLEDAKTYELIAYDKMLKSMVNYDKLQSSEAFPMTVRDYIGYLCQDLGIEFANAEDTFVNYDKVLDHDMYSDITYTYRDIFDELAQVTASNILINENDQLEIRYITDTGDTIDEPFFSDTNVQIKQKYGPINSVVLSRAEGTDNIYLKDDESIAQNGLCELKIEDNQIMNNNDRDTYLQEIFDKLNGLTFYTNDYESKGICYYEVGDKYDINIEGNTYPSVMFSDNITITTGLNERVETDLPEQAQTDYTKSDKTDRRIRQAYLIIDKQNATIESVTQEVSDQNSKIAQSEQTIEGFRQTVESMQKVIDEGGFVNEERLQSAINQSAGIIQFNVSQEIAGATEDTLREVDGKLELYIEKNDTNEVVSAFNLAVNKVIINSDNFELTEEGDLTARNANLENVFVTGGNIELYETEQHNPSVKIYGNFETDRGEMDFQATLAANIFEILNYTEGKYLSIDVDYGLQFGEDDGYTREPYDAQYTREGLELHDTPAGLPTLYLKKDEYYTRKNISLYTAKPSESSHLVNKGYVDGLAGLGGIHASKMQQTGYIQFKNGFTMQWEMIHNVKMGGTQWGNIYYSEHSLGDWEIPFTLCYGCIAYGGSSTGWYSNGGFSNKNKGVVRYLRPNNGTITANVFVFGFGHATLLSANAIAELDKRYDILNKENEKYYEEEQVDEEVM